MTGEMSHTIVLGGGLCGLSAAMMLARDGHRVTVLERDAAPVPADPEAAWERWRRDGVVQFRQAHYLQPRGRAVLDAELPDVRLALEAAGALRFDPLAAMSPAIGDRAPRDGDERFVTLTGRRSTLEQVIGHAAEAEPGVEIRRGVNVAALETRRIDGRVHVDRRAHRRAASGSWATSSSTPWAAARTLPKLLAAAGGDPVHEEAEDTGFLYYTRYFRGELPRSARPDQHRGRHVLDPDAAGRRRARGAMTLYGSSRDQPLKALRDPARWTAVVRASRATHTGWTASRSRP